MKMSAAVRVVAGFVAVAAAAGFTGWRWRASEASRPPRFESAIPDLDYFYMQRAGRDGRLDLRARRAAVAHARMLTQRAELAPRALAAGEWTLRGPVNVGGRVADIAGDPADPQKLYVGAA